MGVWWGDGGTMVARVWRGKGYWAEGLTTIETIFRRRGPGPGSEPKRPILIPRVMRCEDGDVQAEDCHPRRQDANSFTTVARALAWLGRHGKRGA